MSFDFDRIINRENTQSVKFDARKQVFGTEDVYPMWVADMDFAVPDCVHKAVQARANHPIYGYSLHPESLYRAMIEWYARRHHWPIERDSILLVPGVVPSIFAVVKALVPEGGGVIVQSPVYFPFFSAITTNKRRLVDNPLCAVEGHYYIDFEHLERCASEGARMLLFCTPHNPVGRVWTPEELERVLDICRRYQLILVSDDIHCDLVYPGQKHTMLARLARPGDKIVKTLAPSKTFNIPGLGLSALVIDDVALRQAVKQEFEQLHVANTNPFSAVAFEAAYRGGDDWLDALMPYLQETCRQVKAYLDTYIPQLKMQLPEATYLLWLDCRALQMSDAELRDFFIRDCRLGLSPGSLFGPGGSGHMRLNIGAPRSQVLMALEQLAQGLAHKFG